MFHTLKLFKWKTPTYLIPSCRNCSLYRQLWLDYNLCSGSISFWNRNTRTRSNSPLLHKVAHSHQWILCSFGILVDPILICFQDLAHIQMGRGLYLPKNSRTIWKKNPTYMVIRTYTPIQFWDFILPTWLFGLHSYLAP